jgi:alpha-tubulin suppressor-like RCC1 family protein
MSTKKVLLILIIVFMLLTNISVLEVSAEIPSMVSSQEITGYSKISSGYRHVCALNDSGVLKCWGSNTYGQIGDDSYSFAARSTPGSVPGLETETIIDFEAGGDNTCIINSDGALKCWGGNNYHELGNPDYFSWASGTPVQVLGMESNVTDVAIGNLFICAIKDGDAYCWGYDYTGSDPDSYYIEEPQLVDTPYTFESITANGGNVCAISTDKQLVCWGTSYNAPTLITGLENVVSVSISETEKCALIAETITDPAKVMCWGGTPTEVGGLQGVPLAIAGGKEHTCAIVQDAGINSVMCWGSNNEGQLGLGHTTDVSEPTTVPGSEGAIRLSAGEAHTNIVTESGQVRSWGANTEGQLGNGALFRRQLPIHLQNINEPLENVVSGEYHTCALTQAGAMWCWGGNEYGQVGNGSTQYVADPVTIINDGVDQIYAGPYDTCALLDTSEVMCWGINPSGSLGTNDPSSRSTTPRFVVNESDEPITGIVDLGCGNSYICALKSDGSVFCWGANTHGQLGVPISDYSWRRNPIQVQNFPGMANALAVGAEYTCAISDTMDAYCWGVNHNGNLGLGYSDSEPHDTPSQVITLDSNLVDVSAGYSQTCVLSNVGSVSCWGGEQYGSYTCSCCRFRKWC